MSRPSAAIPTVYKGIQLKSRMEAQCAFLFDQLGWEWKYEPESLMLSNGTSYIPDFLIDDLALVVECRGYRNPRAEKQLTGFIRDMPLWAQKRDERVSFLVMGPEACAVHECDVDGKAREYPAAVTYCARCDEWYLDEPSPPYREEYCPACALPIANNLTLTVADGKFTIGTLLFDEAERFLSRDLQRHGWSCSLEEHVWEILGRPDRNSTDWSALSLLLMELLVVRGER